MRILAKGQIHDTQCVSPDGQWVVFDSRSAGLDISQSTTISKVHLETGEVVPLYSVECHSDGPGVAAATFSPCGHYVLFIHGVRPYAFHSRFGMLAHADGRGAIGALDRPPLRGGTHAHTWHPNGQWLSCTYNDALLPDFPRTVAVLTAASSFVVASPVVAAGPGSDEFEKAFDECWVGDRPLIAFQGNTRGRDGDLVVEVFLADLSAIASLPELTGSGGEGANISLHEGGVQTRAAATEGVSDFVGNTPPPSSHSLRLPRSHLLPKEEDLELRSPSPGEGVARHEPGAGTATSPEQGSLHPLQPPPGITTRRLTHSRGIQGVRHWLRATPDGSRIACLLLDSRGISQIHLVSVETGTIRQLTANDQPVDSPFNFSPDGARIAYSCGNRVCVTDIATGETWRGEMGEKPINGVIWTPDGAQLITNRVINGEQVITIESS